jgi:hypothetical protein
MKTAHVRKRMAEITSQVWGCVIAYNMLATPLIPVADGTLFLREAATSPIAEDAASFLRDEPYAYKPFGSAEDSTPSSQPHCKKWLT